MENSAMNDSIDDHACGPPARNTQDNVSCDDAPKSDILLNILENMGRVATLLSTLCKNMPSNSLCDGRPPGENMASSSQECFQANVADRQMN